MLEDLNVAIVFNDFFVHNFFSRSLTVLYVQTLILLLLLLLIFSNNLELVSGFFSYASVTSLLYSLGKDTFSCSARETK